ncbi:MAG: ABC transporter ATP-binding protein [Epulopiscium sp.]|nr:ABC transporter ATP-binding protein [Candidatus Epulonipiscium sp.]
MAKNNIKIDNLSFSYDNQLVLNKINLDFEEGKLYSIIGPNGSGKSTMIKNISKVLIPESGKILINDKDIAFLNNKELSQKMSVIHQNIRIDYDFTVAEIVMMGRSPHKRRLEEFNTRDQTIIEKYMKITNTWKLRNKFITALSGGEFQRVIAAKALSQETDIILLDEPTSNLDIQYQVEFLKIFSHLKTNKIIIAVLHDLNLASTFSDEIILLDEGEVVSKGNPWQVMNKENIKGIYHIPVEVIENPINKCPHVIPIL